MEKSLLDYGYEIISASKEPISFIDLFNKIVEAADLKLSQNEAKTKMSKVYTQLSLDGRFILLTNNTWDLKVRHKYEQINLDTLDAAAYDEEENSADAEEEELLRQELGEVAEEDDSQEDDDLDFDKPIKDEEDF